jgi:hypothetical protein
LAANVRHDSRVHLIAPLLARAALVVEPDAALGGAAYVRHDEDYEQPRQRHWFACRARQPSLLLGAKIAFLGKLVNFVRHSKNRGRPSVCLKA